MRAHPNLGGACPICAAPSNGNKSYQSKKLYGHLMLRHETDVPKLPSAIIVLDQPLAEIDDKTTVTVKSPTKVIIEKESRTHP